MGRHFVPTLSIIAISGVFTLKAYAECPTIDFEDFSIGTAITDQYDGVTFSVVPQTCGGAPNLFMRIASPGGGTSSGSNAIKIEGGCPSFSDDYLVMTFEDGQREVRFTVGDWGTTYTIRAFDSAAGGAPFITQNVVTGALGQVGVHRLVVVKPTELQPDIIRIEVQGATSNFEAIDDLLFNIDDTPPIANILSPAGALDSRDICVCDIVTIRGIACDDDGVYGFDQLEYRPSGSDSWILVGNFVSPLCIEGTLYNWITAGVTEGFYDLRLNVQNNCEFSASDTTTVYLDRHFDLESGEIRKPQSEAVVGGNVCFEGTIWDRCFSEYTVGYRPADVASEFMPVDPSQPVYTETVTNDPFATWPTNPDIPDGNYETRIRGLDLCGNVAEIVRKVTVDNTPPEAEITFPENCNYVEGVVDITGFATDEHFGSWSLSYIGGDATNWVNIASGTSPILPTGTIAAWDTTSLRRCAYTLRLRVTDKASLGCTGNAHVVDRYVTLNVGFCGDFDADDDGDVDLIDFGAFQDEFTGPLP